nr:hypothetical protein [Tanacetum cinerariifolium]
MPEIIKMTFPIVPKARGKWFNIYSILTCSLRSIDVSIDEGIPEKEHRFDDEEADIQRAVEEILKSVYDAPRGPLPPVVIREIDSGNFNRFQRFTKRAKRKRTPASIEPSGHDGSSSIYAALGLTNSALESDREVPPVVKVEAQDEGQAGPNPGVPTEGQVGSDPEEPASSTGTLSSLQNLDKDFSFGDLFFNDKPFEADNEKTTTKTEVESMVSVIIQQATSVIPHMTTPVIDLTSRPNSPNALRPLKATATETTTITTTTHPPPPQPQQSTTNSMLIKRIDELEQFMANLIQDNKYLEERLDSHGLTGLFKLHSRIASETCQKTDMKEILHQRMWETNAYKAHEDHMMLYEALKKSMNHDHTDELLKDLVEARKKKKKRRDSPKMPPGSPPHQPPHPLPPTGPSGSSGSPGASGSSQVMTPPPPPPFTNQEAWTTTDTRLRPSVSSIPKYLHMDDDMASDAQVHLFDDEDIENAYIPKVNLQQDWWKPLEEDRPATPEPACKPLPLGGPPGQVTIQSDFFFNKDLEYLRYDSKGSRPALSISKIKAAYYLDVGLEQMVPDHMWIEEECKYDIAYIDRHTSKGDCRAVRTYMRILSVVRIEVFSMYGYQTQLNLTKPRWDATGFEYKHDFMVIDSSRAVTFREKYGVKMIMRFNEIHKFSDGTLHQICEALDYRVKEFKVNRISSGLNIRF